MVWLSSVHSTQPVKNCCRTLSDTVGYEIRLFWAFSWRDWSASIIAGTIRTISALRTVDSASTGLVIRSIAHSLGYFALFLYAFNIAGQINSVDEDRINKPDRPLPSGLVTLKGAGIRWYAMTLLFLAVGVASGVFLWTILWVFITVYLCFCGGDKHWFTKNLVCMSAGSVCLLQVAWALGAPITVRETCWAAILSCVTGIVANVQDLRDVDGDKITGRRTLPVVLGDNFRWVMAAIICVAPSIGKNNKKKPAPPPESLFHILHPASSPSRAIISRLLVIARHRRHAHAPRIHLRGLSRQVPRRPVRDRVRLRPGAGPEWGWWTCETPVRAIWKEFADAALADEERAARWGGVSYWFVMGMHPHEAWLYDDAVEADILEAMTHPGEIGLDYHYESSS
ncbi:UbiA prenyltransferase [Mycena sanguinolenta]|uniref:UbiA prenyltransferase n=1 Tax=Mycena sanguinolenta TaxID=230812 RepID=A0A8H6ZGR9_9AGAR|nr:UbiA prenyltransferase [Mycena sanguinolenta]